MKTNKNSVKNYMRKVADIHWDPTMGQVNATTLAEDAANHFNSDYWLDDPDHWIWEIALDVVDEYMDSMMEGIA